MAGKRVSLASLAAAKVEAVPGASRPDLIHVHPDTVAPTPLNPRRAFDETELTELGEDMRGGQLQPCVAVARAAYLKLYPEHTERLPDGCRYVMAAGERRWRAAIKVGLDSLDVMLRHDLTESRVRFLAAVLSENVQRANFNPIEEADGLRAMLELHNGNQAAAARAMGKSKAWFNQRIGLLRLSDEMVELVLSGELTAFRDMRRYAALPQDEQYATWKRDQEQPPPAKQAPPVKTEAEKPSGGADAYTAVYAKPRAAGPVSSGPAVEESRFTAVSRQPAPAPEAAPVPAEEQPAYTAVYAPPAPPVEQGVPEPRAAVQEAPEADVVTGRRFPYGNGPEAARFILERMPPEEFARMFPILFDHYISGPEAARYLIERMPAEEFNLMFQVWTDHYRSRHGSLD